MTNLHWNINLKENLICAYSLIIVFRHVYPKTIKTIFFSPLSYLAFISPWQKQLIFSQGKSGFWQSVNVFAIQNCCSNCISGTCLVSRFLVEFKKGAIPSFAGCRVEVRHQTHDFVQSLGIQLGLNRLWPLCPYNITENTITVPTNWSPWCQSQLRDQARSWSRKVNYIHSRRWSLLVRPASRWEHSAREAYPRTTWNVAVLYTNKGHVAPWVTLSWPPTKSKLSAFHTSYASIIWGKH